MSSRTEKIEIYKETPWLDRFWGVYGDPEWRWRYKATNGKILADGGEGYKSRADAVRGALRVTGLDIPGYLGDIDVLRNIHRDTLWGRDLDQMAADARTDVRVRGLVYYFFDHRITNRPYDVELVQL